MNMARSIVLFAALFFTALVAGGAFVIWIDYNPAGMSAAFYVEKMQHAIRVFTRPLPTIVMLSVLFSATSAFLARRERPGFYLLVAATICAAAVALITAFGNIPINNQIKTWSVVSPPSAWLELSAEWWRFQTARTTAAICGLALLILAALIPHRRQTSA
jgi:uncharacterized membrane protein